MENLPITLNYSLTDDEIKNGADVILGTGKFTQAIVRTVLLVILTAVFTRQYIFPSSVNPNYILGGILILICIVLTVFSWLSPGRVKINFISEMTKANGFSVTFSKEDIVILNNLGKEEKIGIDDITVEISEELFIIKSALDGFLFIPQRVLTDEYDEIRKILDERNEA